MIYVDRQKSLLDLVNERVQNPFDLLPEELVLVNDRVVDVYLLLHWVKRQLLF